MIEGFHHADLSIDQQLALRTSAVNLQREFGGVFGAESIERFLHSSHEQFATRAQIPNFLPLLAERFARQRLTALARVEGKLHDGKPVVLSLCTHNAGRSQIALGYFQHLAGENAVAWSGGSEPGEHCRCVEISARAAVPQAFVTIAGSAVYPAGQGEGERAERAQAGREAHRPSESCRVPERCHQQRRARLHRGQGNGP